jgi:D-alanyl-D-alanine carboxypeptidase
MSAALRPIWHGDTEGCDVKRVCGLLVLLLLGACGREAAPSVSRAARAQLDRFLEVFNRGDADALRAYARAYATADYDSRTYVDQALLLHKQFGGFDLLEVEQVRSNWLTGWVRARDSDAVMEIRFDVDVFPPHRMTFVDFASGDTPRRYFPVHGGEAEAVRALRQELRRRAAAGKFSGVALLARGDRILVREAHGLADRARNVANTVDTRFRTASLGQVFTAVAVLRLVQDRRLGLEDPIGKIVPELSNQPIATATISQLLAHTSGAGDFVGPKYIKHRHEIRSHDDFVKFFGGDSLNFMPGERFGYSNLGYIWLGTAIERASGRPYHEYVRSALLERAAMKHTDYAPPDASMEGRALGYQRPPGTRDWNPTVEEPGYRGGAGGAFSTVDDVARFLTAVRGHRLLDEKHARLLTEPRVELGPHRSLGLGVYLETYPWSERAVGIAGGEPGASAEAWFLPESGYSLVVLSNFDPNSAAQVAEFARGRLPLD